MSMEKHSNSVVRTSEVIDYKVLSPNEEDLGRIIELVLDKQTGETRYAVLAFGGFLGLGEKLFPIPWKALTYKPEFDTFVLNIQKDQLKAENGFDKENWPNFADPTWAKNLNNIYKIY